MTEPITRRLVDLAAMLEERHPATAALLIEAANEIATQREQIIRLLNDRVAR